MKKNNNIFANLQTYMKKTTETSDNSRIEWFLIKKFQNFYFYSQYLPVEFTPNILNSYLYLSVH